MCRIFYRESPLDNLHICRLTDRYSDLLTLAKETVDDVLLFHNGKVGTAGSLGSYRVVAGAT